MFDTVKITKQQAINGKDFMIKDFDSWRQTNLKGELVEADKTIFFNKNQAGNKWNGTMKLYYEPNKEYLNISFSSLPAIYLGTSLKELPIDSIYDIERAMIEEINKHIDTDLKDAFYSRIDNSAVYNTINPVYLYIAFLDAITRDKEGHYNKKYYERETIEFFNNQKTIGFYDKYAKNKKNEIDLQNYSYDSLDNEHPMLRFEIQNKTAQSIRRINHNKNLMVGHLSNQDFIDACFKQRRFMFGKIFSFDKRNIIKDIDNVQKYLSGYEAIRNKKKRGRIPWQILYREIIRGTITIKDLEQMSKANGETRQATHSFIKQCKGLIEYDKKQVLLYQELRDHINSIEKIKAVA